MIKLYCLTGLMLAAISCTTEPKTTVTIHMEGERISDITTVLNTRDSIYSIHLDSTNSITIPLASTSQSGYASIQLGRMHLPLYIETGKSFDVDIRIKGRKVTPVFTGDGAAKNNYLNSEVLKKDLPPFEFSESEFLKQLKELETKQLAYLDSMNFDTEFRQIEKKRIHYSLYSGIPTYITYHPFYAKTAGYTPSEQIYTTMKQAVEEDPGLMYMQEYRDALTGYLEIAGSRNSKGALSTLKNRLSIIQNDFKSPAIKEFTTDYFVCKYIGKFGIDNLSEFSSIYESNVTDPQKKASYKALCDKWAKIAKGQPSFAFKFKDINGKEVCLQDLAGKYVYIDCWATWCGPCCAELPYLQKLEHQYKDRNIHFVSISCDRDKTNWEKMVKKEKLGGIQLHNGGDNSFLDFYMITGIPRFILLDREGKIIDTNATRPSNPETAKTFDTLEGI